MSSLPSAPTTSSTPPTTVAAVALAAVVVLTAALARLGVSAFEQAVFGALFGLPGPVHAVLVGVMPLGSFWAAVAAGPLGLLLGRRTALRLVLAGAPTWLAATALKLAVGRGRPVDVLGAVVDVAVVDGNGFPSGHTAVATALVVALWPDLGRRGRAVAWALPVLVGLARIEVGVHLPLDVVGGAALGALVALGARRAAAGLGRRGVRRRR